MDDAVQETAFAVRPALEHDLLDACTATVPRHPVSASAITTDFAGAGHVVPFGPAEGGVRLVHRTHRTRPARTIMSGIPITLDDGRTWWVENEGAGRTPVLTVEPGFAIHLPVGALKAGMRVVVPAGARAESVPARLIAVGRPATDAAALDVMLRTFRGAARAVIDTSSSKADAIDRVRSYGARHPGQLPAWADGSVFTPREPGDLAAVFFAANRAVPELCLLYSLAREFRDAHRRLHSFVSALAGDSPLPSRRCLSQLLGHDAGPILDDFTVAVVSAVAAPAVVAAELLGRVA